MPVVTLEASDAVELAELLQFLTDWLDANRDQLGVSLPRFTGSEAHDVAKLIDDLARFTFLLGGCDEQLFRTPQ